MKFCIASTLVLLAAAVAADDVFSQALKCIAPDGRITYSDLGCDAGHTSQVINTKPNAVNNSYYRNEARRMRHAEAAAVQLPQPLAGATSERLEPLSDFERQQRRRELDVIINSPSVSKERRAHAEAELSRMARGTDGQRTAEDHRRMRDLEVDLGSIDPKTRREAAAKIEALTDRHESPELVQNRDAQRNAEAMEQAAKAEERRRKAAALANQGPVICDATGCNGPNGRYVRLGKTNMFVNPRGGTCRTLGTQLHCP
jgi:hypothetical protein